MTTARFALAFVLLALVPTAAGAQVEDLLAGVQQANQYMFTGIAVVALLVVLGIVVSVIKHSLKILALLVLLGLVVGGGLYAYGRMKGTNILKQYNVNYSLSPFGWPLSNVNLPDIDVNISISR